MQAVVLSVVLSLIGALTLKWTLGRRSDVVRTRDSVDARSYMEACMSQMQLKWSATGTAADDECTFTTDSGEEIKVNVDVSSDGEVVYEVDTKDLK